MFTSNKPSLTHSQVEAKRLRKELALLYSELPIEIVNRGRSGNNTYAMMSGSELPSAFTIMRLSDSDFDKYNECSKLADQIRELETN